jgi:uncharacterized protein YybS (DUF2232 family)
LHVGRGLTVWLTCLVVLLLLYFGAQVNPLAFLLAGVLAPLPLLLAARRLGARGVVLLALVTALGIFSLKPGLEIIWANVGFGSLLLMGVLLGVLEQRGLPAPGAIMLTVAALSAVAVLLVLGQALFAGISPLALAAQKSGEIMATVRQVLGDAAGKTSPVLPGVSQANMEVVLQRLLPGLVVANTGLVAWLNVVLARQIARFLGWGAPEAPMCNWTVPEWLIFVVLGTGFLLLIPLSWVRFLSLNLLLVLALLYFCQGVAVVATWFNRLSLPWFMRLIGYPLLFLNPFFFLIITLGLIDLWLDFRRLHQPRDA